MFSQKCIDLIKKYEGCRLVAYRCPAGILTIGTGHTGKDVTEGMPITQEQADDLLKIDLDRANRAVNRLIPHGVPQGAEDALTSFVFNLGEGALNSSTLLKLILAGKMDEAAKEFPKWVHSAGQVLPGLVKRRAAEQALFMEK